ncbi:MAG: glucoamylase family protein [Candidatus Fermentibacteraceae bacterium]
MFAILAVVLFWMLAEGLLVLTGRTALFPFHLPGLVFTLTVGVILGIVSASVFMRRSRFGIEKRLLACHRRWLVSHETVVILQGPMEALNRPYATLMESSEAPSAVFILHPRREGDDDAGLSPGVEPLNPAQLQDHARRLAEGHHIDPRPVRDVELLERLDRSIRWFRQACLDLSEACRVEQSAPPTSEWLLDNEYIFENSARDVRLNLPRLFYKQLPALSDGPDHGLPRIYAIARELASQTDLRLDQDNILACLHAYQSVKTLSIGELWAVPQVLRLALLESIRQLARRALSELLDGEAADFWANRLITANRREPNRLFVLMAELTDAIPSPSPSFAAQLVDYIYDESSVLTPVQAWLERALRKSLGELGQREQTRATRDQISIGNAFNSLRGLALLDWKECFEELSLVEQTLRQDPAGIYPLMDFPTRDMYRRAVEDLHRGSRHPEGEVARIAIEMASRAGGYAGPDELPNHVGKLLIGDRRSELSRLLECRETLRFRCLQWTYRHHSVVYLTGLLLFSAAIVLVSLALGLDAPATWVRITLFVLLLIPSSQLALEGMNYLVTRLLPPRTLPKMDYSDSGIPDACRTLVVVPMMLADHRTIRLEAEKLEARFLANRETNLLFALFPDFRDAPQARCEKDSSLLDDVTRRVRHLNQKYGGELFFLFHRERRWSLSEQKFIGWERKRGKLEELNGIITGTASGQSGQMVIVGDPEQLSNVRFVITLDSDTQLPHNTARRMIETISHPLNRVRFDGSGRVLSGYTIIQPRVSASLPSANGSPFSRLFSDPVGIDPYTTAVSDVYQDLSGEGSYHGKGIYDVRAFSRTLSGRFPEALLLSHDLIEGAHVRVGLASDIELFDEFPENYHGFIKRQHRWIRGDWQIADWVLPTVPSPDGGRTGNTLSLLNRWKVLDNLRRSLLPAASLALLVLSWLVSVQAGWVCSALVFTQLFFHSLVQPFTWATSGKRLQSNSPEKIAHDLRRILLEASLLPYQSWIALDAVCRVFYRRFVSHRKLLQWTSAQAAKGVARERMPAFLLSMGLVSIFTILAAAAVLFFRPSSLWLAGPWLLFWFLSPLVGWLLNRRQQKRQPELQLSNNDQVLLRTIARRTWRYFTDLVTEESSWLPPDNYQVAYQNKLAMRTSPTNIGLYLASVLCSHEFGYSTIDEVTDRLSLTMATLDRLERYQGHLLNWYEIQTLAPLNPRYISTVDSGNLLGALWALDPGLEALLRIPVLNEYASAGLGDTGQVLLDVIRKEKPAGFDRQVLSELIHEWESPSEHIINTIKMLRRGEGMIENVRPGTVTSGSDHDNGVYWVLQLRSRLASWNNLTDRYLSWMYILDEKTADEVQLICPASLPHYLEALHHAPTLRDLAHGHSACAGFLKTFGEHKSDGAADQKDWIDRIRTAYEKSRWLAGEMMARIKHIQESVRALSESINMGFLYNDEHRLFSIGYNVSDGRLDQAFYDLLASEARLGSFIAIARGDIPVDHWFAMSRPYGVIGRRRALLSWTGTVFEYLMPLLFQRSFENSLLDKSVREAVAIHINYGRRHRVPWGISECAFADLDMHKTYQYQAFGVPELGLKRGLADKLVVAPYATLLALSVAPQESVQNLKRQAGLGLLNDFGFYEALDYSQQSSRGGDRGVIVQTYMAHHQGMGFLALANFLHDNSLQRHFRSDPRVNAFEPLLHERIPKLPALHYMVDRERVSSVPAFGEAAPSASLFETPHTLTPKTLLLSNNSYCLMLTNSGGGYSRWRGFDVTRWRSDRTRDNWGTFCYIHETDTDRLWCNTYHPTGGTVEGYSVNFTLDRAVYRRLDHGIETETEVAVAPEDDVEIRRMTLVNHSQRTRRLELTSCVELSMAPHNSDRQHPAFSKMFIKVEALQDLRALLACRRPRSENEPPIHVASRFTLETAHNGEMRFDSDRNRFTGRGRTAARPMGALQEPGNSQGFVLDPILSMRQDLTLEPGERVRVSLVLAACATRDQVMELMNRYGDPRAVDRAMDYAWASAQTELRLLRIQPDEARRFQQVASHLLFPNPLLRSTSERIAENHRGQAGLWTYAISGDLPIVLVAIGEERDLALVRQVLSAHSYWRKHGLKADLVILNEESYGYEQPLRQKLEHLIQSHSSVTGISCSGGVYLLCAGLIPDEDQALLRAVACVVMVAARGALSQQLGVPPVAPELPERLPTKRIPRDVSAALPFLELAYFNSLGGFTPDGREYAIYLGPGINTPAPWVNVIANPSFGVIVSETGAGFTWHGNSQRNRLTAWANDPVTDPPSEALYIRDEETGAFWTPTASPVREETAYRVRHGAGYSVFEHNSQGIEQELTVFVPVNSESGLPIKLQRLMLKNDSGRTRRLSLTYYLEWTLGESRETSQMHVATRWDDEIQAVIASNHYNPDFSGELAFAAMSASVSSHTGDRTAFIGRNRSMRNPVAMERVGLSQKTGAGLDPCAGLQTIFRLAPDESLVITCMLGQAGSMKQVHDLVLAHREGQEVEDALRDTQEWWDDLLGMISVKTPELATDFMVNRWLPYQNLVCRIWGRSGLYQSGGAYGFRDQLQDVMGLLYSSPATAREHILLAASRQFIEGDVQHWWHPPGGEGIRSRVSDDLLWLPFVVAQYVRVTADMGILGEMIPFLEAPVLREDEHESYQSPAVSTDRASLFEHCQRAVIRSQAFGVNGLPLMGTGDWNDGMSLVGAEGRGESVWLAWFQAEVLKGMAEMAECLGRPELGVTFEKDRSALLSCVEQNAWDGEWYLRAIFDDGSPLGSKNNPEAEIDSLPQSWAWLGGGVNRERASMALESAWQHLVHRDEGLVLLFDPPFDQSKPSPGYIMGYPPGVRENGGQYTHAALWLAMAMARSGDGSRAVEILRITNPIEQARDPENVWRYRIEPYVAAADVYSLPGHVGQGGWSWYTGSAAWMYRAWIEEVLGLCIRGETMRINPVIPKKWNGFRISLRHGEAVYEIRVDNPEHSGNSVAFVELDGRRITDGVIELSRELVKHRVLVRMGAGTPLSSAAGPPPLQI